MLCFLPTLNKIKSTKIPIYLIFIWRSCAPVSPSLYDESLLAPPNSGNTTEMRTQKKVHNRTSAPRFGMYTAWRSRLHILRRSSRSERWNLAGLTEAS
jgi:hypothetical protein